MAVDTLSDGSRDETAPFAGVSRAEILARCDRAIEKREARLRCDLELGLRQALGMGPPKTLAVAQWELRHLKNLRAVVYIGTSLSTPLAERLAQLLEATP